MLRWVLIATSWLALGLIPTTLQAADPIVASFDCARAAMPNELAICQDPALAREDRDMAALFRAAQTSAWGNGPSNQLAVQRQWLKDKSCNGDRACLMMSYKQRNGDLAVAALFTAPDLAFTVLKRVKPDAAGLYQAIVRYTQIGPGRDAQPDALLRPYWARLQSGEWRYGQEIVGDTIKRPTDITRSDAQFGLFVYVVSAYLGKEDEIISHPFPCTALIRRPGLVSAITPVFGSTFDTFAMYPDCEASLPPQPRFQTLYAKVETIDPDCEEGTIRYALYKQVGLDMALAQMGADPGKDRLSPIPKRLAGLAAAATAELADQYWRYAGMGRAQAQRRAQIWVAKVANYRLSCGE